MLLYVKTFIYFLWFKSCMYVIHLSAILSVPFLLLSVDGARGELVSATYLISILYSSFFIFRIIISNNYK